MNTIQWDDELDDVLAGDELLDTCDRCGAVMTSGHCTEVEISFPITGAVEWFWCDECSDSFTAWRLSADPPLRSALPPPEQGG